MISALRVPLFASFLTLLVLMVTPSSAQGNECDAIFRHFTKVGSANTWQRRPLINASDYNRNQIQALHDFVIENWLNIEDSHKRPFVEGASFLRLCLDDHSECDRQVNRAIDELLTDLMWVSDHHANLEDIAGLGYLRKNLSLDSRARAQIYKDLRGHWVRTQDNLKTVLEYRQSIRNGGAPKIAKTDAAFFQAEDELAQAYLNVFWQRQAAPANGLTPKQLFLQAEKWGDPMIDLFLKAASKREGRPVARISDLKEHPSPQDFAAAYSSWLEIQKIPKEHSIEIRRPCRKERGGALIWIPYTAAVPEGYEVAGNIPSLEFFEGLSNGYMAFGSFRDHVTLGFSSNTHTMTQHDLGHLAGFMASPQYMQKVRGVAGKVVAAFRNDASKSFYPIDFEEWQRGGRIERLDYFFERLALVKTEATPAIRALIPELELTAEGFYQALSAKSPEENLEWFEKIHSQYRSWILPLGGMFADLYTLNSETPYTHDTPFFSQAFKTKAEILEWQKAPTEAGLQKWRNSFSEFLFTISDGVNHPESLDALAESILQ
jgi:hypothetical protein